MKKIRGTLKAYLIFVAVCIILAAAFLIYVHSVIMEYDRAQPERVVQQYIGYLSDIAEDGTLMNELHFEELCGSRYENNDAAAYAQDYSEKVRSGLSYEYIASKSSELSKTYSIRSQDEAVGTLTIIGENSRTSLFFFSMADWSVTEYVPLIADTVYDLRVYCPVGTDVYINGTQPSVDELDSSSDTPVYDVQGLLHEPTIEYRDMDGESLMYTVEDNTVMPVLFDTSMTFPPGISVEVNGKPVEGILREGIVSYDIRSMNEPIVSLSDKMGLKYSYLGEFEADIHTYAVSVPEEYTVTMNGRNADDICIVEHITHDDAAILYEKAGIRLKDTKSYTISLLSDDLTVCVTDDSGVQTTYEMTEPTLIIDAEKGVDEIPEDISAQLDVLEIAKMWSRFMTDDLEGESHGLEEMRQYFIKDSDYYRYAAEWALGPDIKFTSPHTLDSFTGERVSNFVQYSESCFSCEVYFEKNMSLLFEDRFAGFRTDVFHSKMYFLYTDDTPDNGVDDPHWAIAVMHDVI